MRRSSWKSLIMLLLIMKATFTLASQAHRTEPNEDCLTEERYNATFLEMKKDLSVLKEQGDIMKEELERIKQLLLSMSNSLSLLSSRTPSPSTDILTESPMSTQTPLTVNTTTYEEFYEAARIGDIGYITAELVRGNSSLNRTIGSNSKLGRMLTWHNKDNHNWTVLHVAAFEGHDPVVLALLEAGASPNVKDSNDGTPVHMAAITGRIAVLRTLLQPKYQAKVNVQDDKGYTPVAFASLHGHTGALEVLVDHGSDVNMADNIGWSPLMWASDEGSVGSVQALINAGARVGDANEIGETALHVAANYNSPDVVRLLLQNGADKWQEDKWGHTPADAAKGSGDNDIAALINNWQ